MQMLHLPIVDAWPEESRGVGCIYGRGTASVSDDSVHDVLSTMLIGTVSFAIVLAVIAEGVPEAH